MVVQTRQIHLNKPQLRSLIIGAPVEYLVAGRGTGKTEGVLAPKTAKCYFGTMPRATGVIVGATYNQLLTRTLPGLVAGWEKIGYRMEQHFTITRRPSEKWIKKWKWQGPLRPPLDYKYFVSWWNGAGAHLVSQDRVGSANGITIDWICGDEAKLLNYEKLKTELFPANRGIIPDFVNNPYHHGMTFTTDMPVGTAGRWILDMVNEMDKDAINEIWRLQTVIFQLKSIYKSARKPAQREILKQIEILNDELNVIRKGILYYHEASTLDNIDALGATYIKQQIRDTSQFDFDTQILNIRPLKIGDGFYPDYDEEYHGYFANNNTYLDNIGFDVDLLAKIDCRRDSDFDTNAPLHIALDYNRRIHPIVVGQVVDKEIRAIKGIHALYPEKLKESIDKFAAYYKPYKRRLIYYWYDHTAVGDDNAMKKCDEVIKYLKQHKFIVIPRYIGQQPGHEIRYRMWGHLLKEDGEYDKVFRLNRENCDKLNISICAAQAEQRKDGFGKDKKSESDPKTPAEESTHYSDAIDTLVFGILESKLSYNNTTSTTGGMVMRK